MTLCDVLVSYPLQSISTYSSTSHNKDVLSLSCSWVSAMHMKNKTFSFHLILSYYILVHTHTFVYVKWCFHICCKLSSWCFLQNKRTHIIMHPYFSSIFSFCFSSNSLISCSSIIIRHIPISINISINQSITNSP